MPTLNRRQFLADLGLFSLALVTPGLALAAVPGDHRFVFVALRGGMDGLHAVPPIGDPDYAPARGALALKDGVIPLGGIYGLHPALGGAAGLYKKGELLVIHAVATPYRERSHFDGQDLLESGATAPHLLRDGWLGRCLPILGTGRTAGLAVGQSVPLSLRGPQPVESWSPSPLAGLSPALVEELGTFQSFIPDAAGPGQRGFRPVDEGFYRGADPTNPQVGDVRLRFEAVNAQQVSVVAGQVGGMLTPFAASNGYEISLIAPGARPAAALFKEAREGEALLTWVLRAAGFVVMVISLSLLFQPLAVLVSVLPFLGSLVEGGAFLVSVALSIPLTLITIAIAWFAHRPLLAGALIISGLVVTLLMAWSKRRKAAAAS